jgi:hypothetical protein
LQTEENELKEFTSRRLEKLEGQIEEVSIE